MSWRYLGVSILVGVWAAACGGEAEHQPRVVEDLAVEITSVPEPWAQPALASFACTGAADCTFTCAVERSNPDGGWLAEDETPCTSPAEVRGLWNSNLRLRVQVTDGDGRRAEATRELQGWPPAAQAVAAGGFNGCAIDLEGRLACWGVLGRDASRPYGWPARTGPAHFVSDHADWEHVAVGNGIVCGLRQDQLYCGEWGRDDHSSGNVLVGREQPFSMHLIDDAGEWTALSSDATLGIRDGQVVAFTPNGELHHPFEHDSNTDDDPWTAAEGTCGLRGGALYCWGGFRHGRLNGHGDEAGETPARVGDWESWTALIAVRDALCGLRETHLYCWTDHGWLNGPGESTLDPRSRHGEGWTDITAVRSDFLSPRTGYEFDSLCGIRDGMLYCHLSNSEGGPTRIGESDRWTSVAGASGHLCGLDGGNVACLGENAFDQAGQSPGETMTRFTDLTFSTVDAGRAYACGLSDGQLLCWGDVPRFHPWYGTGQEGIRALPPTPISEDRDWTALTVRGDALCALRPGELHCFSSRFVRRVGENLVEGGGDWHTIAFSGGSRVCGIAHGGQLSCIEIRETQPPVPIGEVNDWVALSLQGDGKLCALHSSGTLHCGTRESTTLDTVAGEGWTEVAGAHRFTCGIRAGELTCFGDHFGDSPRRIGTETGWHGLTTSVDTVCAMRDNALYCLGQLPDRYERLESTVPVRMTDGAFTQVTVGGPSYWSEPGAFLLALDEHGALWSMGANRQAQLGGGPDMVYIPALVSRCPDVLCSGQQ